MDNRAILVAEIGAAHGLRGEIRLVSWTEPPESIARLGELLGSDGHTYTIAGCSARASGLIVRLAGVNDRTSAEALRGIKLFVARDQFAPLVDEDEFYQVDLVGLAARTTSGEALGQVLHVHNFGAGDILEIGTGKGGETVLISFTRAHVPKVCLAEGFVEIAEAALGEL